MGVEKNITMRQFNGTDYDTLYPKTDVKQIENLTPSSIGAVAKSGGTMTGDLNTGSSDGIHGKIGSFYNINDNNNYQFMDSYNPANNSGIRLQVIANKDDPSTASRVNVWKYMNGVFSYLGDVLRTDTAQSMGFTKIATGSYVGTGTYGSANPNSLTFDFEPKIVFLSVDSSASVFSQTGFMFFIRNQSGSPSWYFYNVAYVGRTITWSGNTLSWYTLAGNPNDAPDRQQFNVSGQRYCYVALG